MGTFASSSTPPQESSLSQKLLLVCLVAALSYLAAAVGWTLVLSHRLVQPLWPSTAILVSVLLLAPRRIWPVLITVSYAAFVVLALQVGMPVRTMVFQILSDAAEVLIAALCLGHFFGGIPRLNSLKALATYSFFAVLLAPLAGAFIAPLGMSGGYWITWRIVFFSEALEFLIVLPAILGLFSEGPALRRKSRWFYLEAAAQLLALVLFGYLAFDTLLGTHSPALLYSLVPVLLWSALRFGPTGVSASMIVVAVLSLRGAVLGEGPFDEPDSLSNLLSFQSFLFFTAAIFMVLACLAREREHGERELRTSEEKFSTAFREAPIALMLTSARDHRYIDVNETFENISGFTRDEVVGRTPFDIGIWERPTERVEVVDRLLKEGSIRNFEHRFRTKSGEIRAGFSSAELIEIEGEPCMLAATKDVTDRRRAEEGFRLAVESAPNGLLIVSRQGTIVLANHRAEEIFGYPAQELLGQSVEVLVPETLRHGHLRHYDDFFANPEARAMGAGRDLQARRKDGTQFPVEIALNPMNTAEGTRILCTIVDI